MSRQIQRGMTAQQVLDSLGPPRRVARQILYRRAMEQWIYAEPRPLRITLDWYRGQEAHVVSVQPDDLRSR